MIRVTARIPHPDENGEPVEAGDTRLVEPTRAKQLLAMGWIEALSPAVAEKVAALTDGTAVTAAPTDDV